ncbi:peptidase [Methylobacterium sp. Leaf104]|uniref:PepSY-associated TM helix domain-containing protein n=1 Tax=Methylobacterium TaxID=407 RepID=UPI0006FAA077|nr:MULTISPECIES: PepSY-associated TM helix domain-containing protein [Methylobacterium]KQP30029.1 peptidase [Methylobacterium sp. Leaf104]MCI9881425.1 PepSY domain-containing protein [Methylobacterium goesingense]
MGTSFRQAMAWLHTWSGLVVGWVLLAVFVTGTASYYRADISRWMRPELPRVESLSADDLARAAELGVAHLAAHAGGARTWFIGLPTPDSPVIDLFWRTRPGTPPGQARLDPATGAPAAIRDTKGGDFLYRFHFELHMPPLWGRWIVGLCAMIMLVALISGIVTHRRIFADFFTLRRDKAPRRGWLDAHNVTGVLALPFHLMITYTGIVTLSVMYMPWGITTAYRGEAQTFFAESGQIPAPRPPAGQPGTLAPIGPMVREAMARVSEPLERLSIANPRDAHAVVTAVFEEPHGLSHEHPQVAFDGATGAVREVRQGGLKPATRTFTTLVGLHEAHFAGPALRILFFLCGLMGSAMVATGLVLWSVARLPRPGERGFLGLRLVQALNIGAVAGLPAAIAAYFLANRLVPPTLSGRADWEIGAFFATWLLVTLAALAGPSRRAWGAALTATAGLYLAVLAADLALVDHRWAGLPAGEARFLWFDATLLALAGLFALAARKLARYAGPRRAARQAPVQGPDSAVRRPGLGALASTGSSPR